MANTSAADWDEGSPVITDARRLGAGEILNLRKATALRAAKEHEAYAGSSVGGEHLAGSAKVYYQASAPTTRPDGSTALDSDDAGRLWIDSDDGSLYRWSGSAWVAFDSASQSFDLPGSPGSGETWTYGGTAFPLVAPFATPITVSGLNQGKWMFFVAGMFNGDQTGTISITINGQSKSYDVSTTFDPGVKVPFFMAIRANVGSGGTASISAVSSSNIAITRLESFNGIFIG